jgi:hypothetical protein
MRPQTRKYRRSADSPPRVARLKVEKAGGYKQPQNPELFVSARFLDLSRPAAGRPGEWQIA